MLKNTGNELESAQEASRAKLRAMIFAGEFRAGHRLPRSLVSLLRAVRADQPDNDPRAA